VIVATRTADELDVQELLTRAQAETGLSDWGDPTLPDRFSVVVEHINSVPMTAAGRKAAAEVCVRLLTNRLRFFEDRKRFPIADEVIEPPMFATGLARSGTTLMHALMSVDPGARALRFWEVMQPSPPPGTVGPDDPRKAEADDEWRAINTKLWKWLRSHPYNDMLGDGLPEDERTWNFDFRAIAPTAWWRVPMRNVSMGILPTDPAVEYGIHKMMLQQLQYNRPKKYWVLKGFHGSRLNELFATYPDANLVWLHRDPVQTAASGTMLISDIREGLTGKIDLVAQARIQLEQVRENIGKTMTGPLVNDSRIHHVRYSDFVADPIATIRGYYEFTGRELTPAAETAMRDYLASNKSDRHGKFEYSTRVLTDAGYDIDALNEEFRGFRERFGVEIENRD
jgi:Sulfotransferase family